VAPEKKGVEQRMQRGGKVKGRNTRKMKIMGLKKERGVSRGGAP